MKIEKIGRVQYAFGMEWAEVEQEDLRTALDDLDDKGDTVYFVTQGVAKKGLFGLGGKRSEKAPAKAVVGSYLGQLSGKVASYAATLASVAENGFYVARVNDELLWYCSIFDGQLISGSDIFQPRVKVVERIGGLLLNYPDMLLHADEHSLELFRQAGYPAVEFDPVRAIAKAKPVWLTRRGTSKGEMVAAGAIAVTAIAGFSWLYMALFPAPQVNTGPTPEEIRAIYLSSVRSTLPSISADPLWAHNAFAKARAEFPPFRSGWTLQNVMCAPNNGCSASYAPMSEGIWYSHEAFGVPSVANRIASKSFPTPNVMVEPTDDEILYSYPAYGRPAGEVVGSFGLRFPTEALQGEVHVDNISSNTGAEMPEGSVPLIAEKIIIGQSTVPDFFLIRKVTAYFAEEGFRPSQFIFSHGYGAENSNWKIEFVRLRSET
jgi:hypothetical protein